MEMETEREADSRRAEWCGAVAVAVRCSAVWCREVGWSGVGWGGMSFCCVASCLGIAPVPYIDRSVAFLFCSLSMGRDPFLFFWASVSLAGSRRGSVDRAESPVINIVYNIYIYIGKVYILYSYTFLHVVIISICVAALFVLCFQF